jgi:tetratricopeptide (TPR) repeat protein
MAILRRLRLVHVLLAAAFAAVSAVAFVRLSEPPSAAESQTPSGDTLGGVAAMSATEPGKGNVGEQFHNELAALKQQLAATPDDLTVLGRLAVMHRSAHQPEQAAVYYERYLVIDPANRQMRIDLAQCYAAIQRWDAALEASLSLLDVNPDDPVAMYNIGAIHANRGDLSEARKWWEKVRRQQIDEQLAAKARESLASISSPAQ